MCAWLTDGILVPHLLFNTLCIVHYIMHASLRLPCCFSIVRVFKRAHAPNIYSTSCMQSSPVHEPSPLIVDSSLT